MNKNQESAIAKKLGKRIADKRILAGLTQEQVAESLGIGYEAVSRMERGVAIPNAVRLLELAEIFQCKTDELLLGSSHRPSDQAAYMEKVMADLHDKDRLLVMQIIEQLVDRFRQGGR